MLARDYYYFKATPSFDASTLLSIDRELVERPVERQMMP
jgi:hypothetical protein